MIVLLALLAVACSPEHKHKYQLVEEKSSNATCISWGVEYYECSCGENYSVFTAIDSDAHVWPDDPDSSVAATCAEEGKKVYSCDLCGAEKEVVIDIDPTAHPEEKISVKDVTLAATCKTAGKATVDCSECGGTNVEYTIPVKTDKHYILDDGKKTATPVTLESQIKKWNTTEESTAFVKGTRDAVCPTCDEVVSSLKGQEIPEYNDDAVVGTWSYSDQDGSADTTYNLWSFKITKSASGVYSAEAYKMIVTSGSAKTDKIEITSAAFADISSDGLNDTYLDETTVEKKHVFKMSDGTNNFYITEFNSEDAGNKGKNAFAITTSSAELLAPVVVEKSEHSHTWSYLEGSKAGAEIHYVECKNCGLKNLKQTHNINSCSYCDYNGTDWYKVEVKGETSAKASTASAVIDTFYLKKTVGVSIPVGLKEVVADTTTGVGTDTYWVKVDGTNSDAQYKNYIVSGAKKNTTDGLYYLSEGSTSVVFQLGDTAESS